MDFVTAFEGSDGTNESALETKDFAELDRFFGAGDDTRTEDFGDLTPDKVCGS